MFKHPLELFSNTIFWFEELFEMVSEREILFKLIHPLTVIEEDESNNKFEFDTVKLFRILKFKEVKLTKLSPIMALRNSTFVENEIVWFSIMISLLQMSSALEHDVVSLQTQEILHFESAHLWSQYIPKKLLLQWQLPSL